MKNYKHNAGHMTKKATCPYMVKHLKIFFPLTTRPILTKLCMKHQRPKPLMFCSNYGPGLTLTYFTASSNIATLYGKM